MDSVTFDRYDIQLLAALQQEGRISWVELAERINLSASACQRRVRALESSGVIDSYCAVINPIKAGFDVEAFVAVNVERQNYELAQQFRQALLNKSEVLECHLLSAQLTSCSTSLPPTYVHLENLFSAKFLAFPG